MKKEEEREMGMRDVVTIGDGRRSGIARSGGVAVTGMLGWRRWREREIIYECRREKKRESEIGERI